MADEKTPGTAVPVDTRTYDLAVFIGRFQPLHLGHLSVIEAALDRADSLTILVGSSGQPRDTYNPFTFDERRDMILGALAPEDRARVFVQPLLDYTYNDSRWMVDVQNLVRQAHRQFGLDESSSRVTLIGHSKDHSSFYLDMFPQWNAINVKGYVNEEFVLSATAIRDLYFLGDPSKLNDIGGGGPTRLAITPENVTQFLADFARTEAFAHIVGEFEHIQKYRKPYETLPYKPIFTTVDACVVRSGHVLLIQRRARPGKGLWALPGGFLDADEWIEDAWVRELREETGIKVPEAVLRGSVVAWDKFDAPHRSARGRTITFAYLVHLKDGALPKVKGGDDAAKARWFPLAKVSREMMFEDHAHIIESLTARLK